MTTKAYQVEGMTCQHCVNAVTEEVAKVPGVSSVTVELETGTVSVNGEAYDDAAVAAAVDEAGYSIAS
jgi:copper chaperone